MKFSRFTVDICQGCLDLEGKMCWSPGCALCFHSTEEISDFLSSAIIKLKSGEIVKDPIEEWWEE